MFIYNLHADPNRPPPSQGRVVVATGSLRARPGLLASPRCAFVPATEPFAPKSLEHFCQIQTMFSSPRAAAAAAGGRDQR